MLFSFADTKVCRSNLKNEDNHKYSRCLIKLSSTASSATSVKELTLKSVSAQTAVDAAVR